MQAYVADMRLSNLGDMQYYGPLQVGSQNQAFTLIFDTGSNWMWIPAWNCSSCNSNLYSCSSSSSCSYVLSNVSSTIRIDIQYGKGNISGIEISDQVFFTNDVYVSQHKMLLVDSMYDFGGMQADGICGLGVQSFLDASDDTNIVKNLFNNGKIDNQMFSFRLSQESSTTGSFYSEMVIGGYDSSFFAENLTFFTVVNPNYWAIKMDAAYAEDTYLDSTVEALLDTGTSALMLPTNAFFNFQTYLSTNYAYDCEIDDSGYLECSCPDGNINGFPTLQFSFDGNNTFYTLEPKFYVLSDRYICFLSVGWLQNMNMWILGDKFMHKHYTVFDGGNIKVGLAPMNIPSTQSDSDKTTTIIIIVVCVVVGGLLLAAIVVCLIKKYCFRNRRNRPPGALLQN